MKKNIILSVIVSSILTSSVFATTNEVNSSVVQTTKAIETSVVNIENKNFNDNVFKIFIQNDNSLVKSINKVIELKEMNSIKAVQVTMQDGKEEIFFTNTEGTLLMPGSGFLKEKLQQYIPNNMQEMVTEIQSKMQKNDEKERTEAILKVKDIYEKQLDKTSIIKLSSNDTRKPTTVMLLDSECPHCSSTIEQLNTILEKTNVEIILTSVFGETSIKKSALIYEKMKSAKTNEEKIKILQQYFNKEKSKENLAATPKKENLDKVNQTINLFIKTGVVKGVPFIYEK